MVHKGDIRVHKSVNITVNISVYNINQIVLCNIISYNFDNS